MLAKAKKYRKIVKTAVSLSPFGCLSGLFGRREHTFMAPPSDNDDHVKRVLL